MQELTKRQEKILEALIKEYINKAQPVSSKLLSKKRGFGVCPATIRNELQELTEGGYIYQPHTSAGRAPTAQAYRFFVNKITDRCLDELPMQFERGGNELKFFETLTKSLANASSGLVMTYLPQMDCLIKEGWEEVFENPEFSEKSYLDRFIHEVGLLEDNMDKIAGLVEGKINVFIGEENPSSSEEFSLIITRSRFPNNERGVVAIFGPARMQYQRNISLLQSMLKLLEEF